MIKLSDATIDALVEICNIGMSKSAKQLSLLLNSKIEISIPTIRIEDAETLKSNNIFSQENLLSYVFQTISKDLDGRAILILQKENTKSLTATVISQAPKLTEKEIRACEQEAMVEIGNIMITSCISAIVNMVCCDVQLNVPKYNENTFANLLCEQLNAVRSVSEDVIMLETTLNTTGHNIKGELILLLTEKSVKLLVDSLNKLLNIG